MYFQHLCIFFHRICQKLENGLGFFLAFFGFFSPSIPFGYIPKKNKKKLQTIVQIRTVFAFVGESRALQAYSSALRVAQRLGYKSGFAKGMGLGATYFTVFCCYALLLWYGGYLVRHNYTNGGLAMSTIFAVSIGCL